MEEKMQEMPRDIEAEKALLGNILSEEEALFEVMDVIKPEMFYLKSHREIYSTILDLAQNGNPIDQITVSDRLELNGILEKVGGLTYIDELINYNSILSNTTEYIKLIVEKYKLRKIIEASNKMLRQAYSKEEK
ncbi:MAG: DnaB-like helicase N-terminal domain-containing protein, partial [Clostridium sp.]